MILSVVVCTYNREDILKQCLDAIVIQIKKHGSSELIIVNNNSTDNTGRIAAAFSSADAEVKYIFEEKQGLSHARNAGVALSRGRYVAFIDDDSIVDPDWLEEAFSVIEKHNPDIFGGPVYPVLDGSEPVWFKVHYGIRGDMGETGWIDKGYIVGTNFFIRKELIDHYGGFNPELGMKGDEIGYHEETELVKRAFRENRKVYFCRELIVRDHLPDYKMSIIFYMVSKYMSGYQGVGILGAPASAVSAEALIEEFSSLFSDLNASLRVGECAPEEYLMERLLPKFAKIGRMMRLWESNRNRGAGLREVDSILPTRDGVE